MKIEYIDYGLDEKYLPRKKYANDAGMDVYLKETVVLNPHQTVNIALGFGLEVPKGFMMQLIERSSIALRGISTHISPIDSDYTGEIHLIMTNLTDNQIILEEGDRISQLVMIPITYFEIIKEKLERRETNGLGSSGR